jgi:transposase
MERMSQEQWKRLDVLRRVEKGSLTRRESAQVLGLSVRQVRRLWGEFVRKGAEAVVHGNTGREPANRLGSEVRRQVVKLAEGRYAGFNDQHLTEKLALEGLVLSRSSVRRLLRGAGIHAARKRRPPRHRRRRDRKPQAGMMALWDGSWHDWLEGRGPPLSLTAAIDDATGEVLPGAHFMAEECTAGYLRTLRAIVGSKGLPLAVYMDQHGSLKRNDEHWNLEEELRGEQDPTHVGKALKALGIEAIYALSPQAKGRVERLWGTLQDRLVSELRLANAVTRAEADVVLARYVPEHNGRFAIAPADATPAWRAVRHGIDLDRICSFHYRSVVNNDNTVRFGGIVIDVPPGTGGRGFAQARVEVRQLLDGSWRVYRGDQIIATAPTSATGDLRAIPRYKNASRKAYKKRKCLERAQALS